jgi:hypothetical protein
MGNLGWITPLGFVGCIAAIAILAAVSGWLVKPAKQAMCESPIAWVKDARALGLRSDCKSKRIQFNADNTLVECRMPDDTVICAVDAPL